MRRKRFFKLLAILLAVVMTTLQMPTPARAEGDPGITAADGSGTQLEVTTLRGFVDSIDAIFSVYVPNGSNLVITEQNLEQKETREVRDVAGTSAALAYTENPEGTIAISAETLAGANDGSGLIGMLNQEFSLNYTMEEGFDYRAIQVWGYGSGDAKSYVLFVKLDKVEEPPSEGYVIYDDPLPLSDTLKSELERLGIIADSMFDVLKIILKDAAVVSKTPDSLNALAYTVILDASTANDAVLDLEVISEAAPMIQTISDMYQMTIEASYEMTPATVQLQDGRAEVQITPDAFLEGDRLEWNRDSIVINFKIDGLGSLVDLPESDAFEIEPDEGSVSPVPAGGDYSFTISFAEGYAAGSDFVVKANDEVLEPDADGVYTISNVTQDITITVAGVTQVYKMILPEEETYTVVPEEGSVSPVPAGSSYSFTVQIAEGYKKGSEFAVKANGVVLNGISGVYTISNISAEQTITVEGVVTADTPLTFTVTLPSGDGYTVVSSDETTVEEGTSFTFTLDIAEGWSTGASFAVKANGTALEPNADGEYVIASIRENQVVTVEGVYQPAYIIAPAGTEILVGAQKNYYTYVYLDWEEQVTTEDGQVQFLYQPVRGPQDLSGYIFLRATNPDGVTYTRFITNNRLNAGDQIVVTAEDLHLNEDSFTSSTVYRSFEYNNLDLGDIYLNINPQGYLALDAGETYELNSFRNWFAIESFTNMKVALPDMHYEVVDINGNPSDLVTIVPDERNSCVANLAAGSGSGMAIIKITYDAMTHTEAMAEGYGAGGADPTRFSAIWPERTGIIVVTVGQDGTGIATNMIFREGKGKAAGNKIDAEHDVLFYTGSEGASFSFVPEAGTTVTVARPTVGTKMTYNGFTSDGVTAADDGTVTITGLVTGRTIVKVEKNGLANYQVITAQEVTYTLGDTEGNTFDADHGFNPGDTVRVTFSGLTSPAEKLSGYYNYNFGIKVVGEDGTAVQEAGGGGAGYGYYGFSSMDHYVDITIPEDWEGETYTLTDGWIQVGGYTGGSIGDHRSCTYAKGKGMTDGSEGSGEMGQLPEVVIYMEPEPTTALIRYTSQMNGGFLHSPLFAEEVSSNLAESYGYKDQVKDGVSVLDVLVAAHVRVFGEDFTPETAEDYLVIGAYGSPNMQFGVSENYGGFYLNHAMANDGTMYDDSNYNATTVTTQQVVDGDFVEFFFYEDPYYGDTYNWFVDEDDNYSREFTTIEGEDLELTLKGFFAMSASMFKDADEMTSSDIPDVQSDVQLYLVDPETGALAEIEGAVTDEDGAVTLNFDLPGIYTIAAYGTEDCMFTQILSMTTITVCDEITVYVSMSEYGYLVEDLNGEPMALREVTLNDRVMYNLDDVFREMHELYYAGGAAVGYDSGVTQWGTGLFKIWGNSSGNFAYQINHGDVYVMGLDNVVNDGDEVDAYILKSWYPDTEAYATFDVSRVEARAYETIDLTLTMATYDEDFNMVFIPAPNAVITIDGEETEYVTDADGSVTIQIGSLGSHIVSAVLTKTLEGEEVTAITAPVTIVNVTGQGILRISGSTRYATGLAIADYLKEYTGAEKFENIILTTGTNFADAISGTYLAVQKNAPIILIGDNNGAKALKAVQDYVEANLAEGGTIYVLGGQNAVKDEWISGFTAPVVRISGSTRYNTNLEILKAAGLTGGEILVATGENYPDSLSASASGLPLLMVKKSLTQAQKDYLATLENVSFTILGGRNAVPTDVIEDLLEFGTIHPRLQGSTRYTTSVAVSKHFFPDAESVLLVTGENFPDALAGGVLAYRMGAPLLMTTTGKTAPAAEYVTGMGAQDGVILGGAKAVPDDDARTVYGLPSDYEIYPYVAN